jgi:hypothetical protein
MKACMALRENDWINPLRILGSGGWGLVRETPGRGLRSGASRTRPQPPSDFAVMTGLFKISRHDS